MSIVHGLSVLTLMVKFAVLQWIAAVGAPETRLQILDTTVTGREVPWLKPSIFRPAAI